MRDWAADGVPSQAAGQDGSPVIVYVHRLSTACGAIAGRSRASAAATHAAVESDQLVRLILVQSGTGIPTAQEPGPLHDGLSTGPA